VSNPSEAFECRWQPSQGLLAAYLFAWLLALIALLLADLPDTWVAIGVAACGGHALWVLPRHILLRSKHAVRGLRHDSRGWQLWSPHAGWRAVQLRPDSLALPFLVVLHYRLPGERWRRGLCIPRDALARGDHRRLRVRLKFTRRRWAAPE
jgi:toxin CptA